MSGIDDELVEAVAQVLWEGNSTPFIRWADLSEPVREMQYEQARAVLSVPAVRDALARDAQVREFVDTCHDDWLSPGEAAAIYHDIAALYPEVVSMLRDGKG